jgi:hypothetical protein
MHTVEAERIIKQEHPDLQIRFSVHVEIGFGRPITIEGEPCTHWTTEARGEGQAPEEALADAMTWFEKYARTGELNVHKDDEFI